MFTVEIKDEAVTAALMRLSAAVGDKLPLMQEIGDILVDSTKQRFGAGVSPEGVKWAPKSPTTLAAYGARKSNRIDIRPLFGPSGMLSRQIFSEAQSDQVEVGSNRVYAAVMQFGAAQGEFGAFIGKDKRGRDHFHHLPWGNIPARPFLGISEQDTVNITGAISDWLSQAVGEP